jgi:predicted AAA+ superfamily ATPase
MLKPIIPGKTLLFIDEIQAVPRALLSLRYFYEQMPELHVIAAGSLLDFAIEQVGIPVGRVESLYMHPVSFIEFLCATTSDILVDALFEHKDMSAMHDIAHKQLLNILGEYFAIGGMPEAVRCWQETRDVLKCSKIHKSILSTYQQDFGKYAKKLQIKYVELLFAHIPLQLGQKFKYTAIEGEFRKRELAPALDLLVTAGVAQKVYDSAGQGIPLGAQIDPLDYKVIFLDVALSQVMLGLQMAGWYIDPLTEFVNKGALVEAFVGQEILAYLDPVSQPALYYWHKETRGSAAEVDYLVHQERIVVPIEAKSGEGRTLKSMQIFLESHTKSPYGIRFSTQNYSEYNHVRSYPLYAIFQLGMWNNELNKAMHALR